jgi:hypothetical protein
MTIPVADSIHRPKSRVIVPLAVLRKGALRQLDVSHEGKPVPVLGRIENGPIVIDMLVSSAPESPLGYYNPRRDVTVLRRVVNAPKKESLEVWDYYQGLTEKADKDRDLNELERADNQFFDAMVKTFSAHFLFLAQLDGRLVGQRTIVKYALNELAPEDEYGGSRTSAFTFEVPDLGFAASQHLEFKAPPGLEIGLLVLAETLDGLDGQILSDEPASRERVAHIAINPSSREAQGWGWLEVRPAEQGIFSFCTTAVVILVIVVGFATALKLAEPSLLDPRASIPSPSASILLIGPALFLSWMIRIPEHSLATVVLAPLRHILLALAVVLVLLAGLSAIPVGPGLWNFAWLIIWSVTGLALVRAVLYVEDIRVLPLVRSSWDWLWERG